MLTPASIEQVIGWLDARTDTVSGENVAVPEAPGRVLAEALAAPGDHPAAALAATDGYALSAEATVGASDYNPLPIRVRGGGEVEISARDAQAVVSGQKLPAGADTVLPLDEAELRGEVIDIYAPVAPGDHVIPSGREARSGATLLEAGRVLRPADAALLIELGLASVRVARRPRVGIITARRDIRDAVGPMLRSLVAGDGGDSDSHGPVSPGGGDLAEMLHRPGKDLLLVLGGSGQGSNDHAVEALEQAGELAFRGVAINPGETTTLGVVRDTPVVVLPGPPLAALLGYDLIAGRAVRRLAGRDPALPYGTRRATLDRKIASALGRLECCRVRVNGERAEPLAVSDNRTLATAVRADGFVLVPEHSEGFARDTEVEVHMYDQRY